VPECLQGRIFLVDLVSGLAVVDSLVVYLEEAFDNNLLVWGDSVDRGSKEPLFYLDMGVVESLVVCHYYLYLAKVDRSNFLTVPEGNPGYDMEVPTLVDPVETTLVDHR